MLLVLFISMSSIQCHVVKNICLAYTGLLFRCDKNVSNGMIHCIYIGKYYIKDMSPVKEW